MENKKKMFRQEYLMPRKELESDILQKKITETLKNLGYLKV
jgi:hypothetical protein